MAKKVAEEARSFVEEVESQWSKKEHKFTLASKESEILKADLKRMGAHNNEQYILGILNGPEDIKARVARYETLSPMASPKGELTDFGSNEKAENIMFSKGN